MDSVKYISTQNENKLIMIIPEKSRVRKMETRNIGDVTVAVVMPRFDAYTANDVEAVLRNQIAKGAKKVIVDFSQTEYIASAGLRVLLSAAKSLQKLCGQIVLSSMKPYVYEVFEISGFTQIFKIYASQKEALESLNKEQV